jgi:hypothetical protein
MQLGDANRLKPSKCPSCGKKLDGASKLGGNNERPKPGNVSICSDCCNISIFDENMDLRLPTPEERVEIENLPTVIFVRQMIRETNEKFGRRLH